jgi:hypothetical protein
MGAVRTYETSVYFKDTARRYIPECYLYTRRRENIKSYLECFNWYIGLIKLRVKY